MVTSHWTRTTFAVFVIFWSLQFAAVVSHITVITIWIGFLGAKSSIDVIPYIYTTLLVTATFILSFLFIEVYFQAHSTLTVERYYDLQLLKVQICMIEIIALAYLSCGVEDVTEVVWRTVVVTSIPFIFSVGLAAWIDNSERQHDENEWNEVDKKTPLLTGP